MKTPCTEGREKRREKGRKKGGCVGRGDYRDAPEFKKNGKIHNFKVKIFNILKYGVFLSPVTTPGPTSAGLSDPIENPVRQVSSLQ